MRYESQKKIPPAEDNCLIVSYSIFTTDEASQTERKVLLGQYRSSLKQASFPVYKVKIILSKKGVIEGFDEGSVRDRFLFCMIDKIIKVIDVENYKMLDLLNEPYYEEEAIWGMGLFRSIADRKSRLLLLCKGGSQSSTFLKKIEFSGSLPENLNLYF